MRKLVLASLAVLLALPACAQRAAVLLAGRYHDPVETYQAGPDVYLSADTVGKLYGAQVYWYQVAGRIEMTLRGRKMVFFVASKDARVDGKPIELSLPVLLRADEAWIPLAFLESPTFVSWSGIKTDFHPRTRLLSIDKRSTVGRLRWFSYKDFTRLELETDARLAYSASARGVLGVEIQVPLGIIDGSEDGEIGDGLVAAYSLTQAPRSARLAVRLAKPGLTWRAKVLRDPHRVALDVYRPGVDPSEVVEPVSAVAQKRSKAARAVPSAAKAAAVAAAPAASPLGSGHRRLRIVVDAGHGGKDPGATGPDGIQEKDVTLLAAKQLARLLAQDGVFDVRLTRDDDTFVPLSERSRVANDWGADLFVSLHCNASKTPRDEGFEVYFESEHATDPQAEQLADFENSSLQLENKPAAEDAAAQMLLGELSKTEYINAASQLAALMARDVSKRVGIEDRGVKQAGFYVLRGTHAPAVLFEMAYLTNRRDEVRLQSPRFRRKLVDGVYAGILDYAKRQGWLSEVAAQ